MTQAAGSRPRADARPAPRARVRHVLAGAVPVAAAAIMLALAVGDSEAGTRPAGAAAVAALANLVARRPLARVSAALPTALRLRLRDAALVAGRVEGGVLASAALLMLLRPAWLPPLALGLAGVLLMGAIARLTLCAVLRRALDGADDPDVR